MRSSLAVALLTLLVALVGTSCSSTSDEASPPATVTESEATPADPTREAAPALAGVTLGGDAVALRDFRGYPVLINVWSSW